jgi:hypothetical protein
MNSRPFRGYLVHLTRGMLRDADVDQIILNLEKTTRIRSAYACIDGKASVHKSVKNATMEDGSAV